MNDSRYAITNFLFIGKNFEELTSYDLVIILGNNFYDEIAAFIKKLKESNHLTDKTKIIISGNKGSINEKLTQSEAEIIGAKITAFHLGVECILEPLATNIKENLLFSKELVHFNDFKRILIITKSFATRRVLMCADSLNYPLEKIDIYGLEVDIKKSDWFLEDKAKKRVLEELERISKYTISNDLKI